MNFNLLGQVVQRPNKLIQEWWEFDFNFDFFAEVFCLYGMSYSFKFE